MKTMLRICAVVALMISGNMMFGQHGGHHGYGGGGYRGGGGGYRGAGPYRHEGRVMMVRRSPYRPVGVMVYHPIWRPGFAYHRRWVYFPRYNFYWDNWRNMYLYMNGPMWMWSTAMPPMVVNVNLASERNVELKDFEDDNDSVYNNNRIHQKYNTVGDPK